MDEQKIESTAAHVIEENDVVAAADDEEEFYEKIEAPKFVDFTKPYTFRTDDRYWFCSRVGCDQKHEQEINHEEISKNFVLRVLAARSPNIKLRKALNKDQSSLKCPLSAPAKPSKPRIPKLLMASHLTSDKNGGDPQSKIRPCSKAGSTPVIKSRPVAAKYMTTPRNKMCQPNPNSFRSVQNPKATTIDMPKTRTIAKALVFHSPKKAICVKKSVELHTPLRKICEGMKRLEIGSQKKILKGTKLKPKKPETEDSSRKLKVCKSDKKSKDLAASKSTKAQNKITSSKNVENESSEIDVDVKLIDGSTPEVKSEGGPLQPETSDSSNALVLRAETNDLPYVEDKENMAIDVKLIDGSTSDFSKTEEDHPPQATSDIEAVGKAGDHSNEVVAGQMDDDDDVGKENALNPDDNNRSNNQPLGDKNLTKDVYKKNKVIQTSGPACMKCKKPKPTNIKPFRLRTDERGILREALLEKKLHVTAPAKDDLKDTSVLKKTYRVPVKKNDNCGKETSAVGSKPVTKITQKRPESSQQRPRYMTSLRTRSAQGIVSPQKTRTPFQQLDVIKEKSCKLTSDVVVAEIKTSAASTTRSTSRGKRPVTIAKEPNFHTSHRPRACLKNIA
uniref:uncharacterized protein LOC122598205 n=1 Tax=Erigeron canadensis TaxID=72917 RepID=UPI001CB8C2B4|nr:uncharacterized protein LOC122598205 [Erigeron canadensis]